MTLHTLLIANRGEIACRIMRTAQAQGIRCVAVYSDADRGAQHVRMADEAVYIGASPANDSYLNGAAIIAAAQQTGAQAIHPGYGFLSERADFARAVQAAGLIFVGPSPEVIDALGDKIRAKTLAQQAGVPVVAGKTIALSDATHAASVACDIGFPVLLKAAAGGGGRGMRVVHNVADLPAALHDAATEAGAAFGDDRLFIEKYIVNPRHIEVQIMADTHGTILVLGERDCSTQRRRQKVLEETPAPNLSAATRTALHTVAAQLCEHVGYTSAGTVEFIVDAAENFYFLEVNTRLQVEHTVTELVTGRDLVADMLAVAQGLPLAPTPHAPHGHAIQLRVCAEDPALNFAPSVGRLTYCRFAQLQGSRIDTGVVEGDSISEFYDSMIAKLCVHAPTRAQAIAQLQQLMSQTYIAGVATNLPFAAYLLTQSPFYTGTMHTAWIDDAPPFALQPPSDALLQHMADCAVVVLQGQVGQVLQCGTRGHITQTLAITQPPAGEFIRHSGGRILERHLPQQPPFVVVVHKLPDGVAIVHQHYILHAAVRTPAAAAAAQLMPYKKPRLGDPVLRAAMPGVIRAVLVAAGDNVQKGTPLLQFEAMKMVSTLYAPADACVAHVAVQCGQTVGTGDVLLEYASVS